jgi:peptidoglycan/xylan/chitin deacetylase (PgdA/CDA1 family)
MSPFSPFRWLSPAGPDARLSIFIFHRVLEREDPLRAGEPDASRFERIVQFIATHFHVLNVSDAAACLLAGKLPAAAACITFDDGYADNLTIAAPILKRCGVTATVFVSTAYSDGDRMWNDTVIESVRSVPSGELDWRDVGLGLHTVSDAGSRRAAVQAALSKLKYMEIGERSATCREIARRCGLAQQSALMLTRRQILEWRELGFEVGGHTMRHPILSRMNEKDAFAEIEGGRSQLKEWMGEAPSAFAYPNGVPGRDYGMRDVALVKRAGYACAVSTARGAATRLNDPYQLPRFLPWDRKMWAFGLRCARTLFDTGRAAARGSVGESMEVRT